MTDPSIDPPARSKPSLLAVAGTLAGVLLFIYTLQSAGPRVILDGIRRIGLAFGLVLALSAVRMIVRAKAWTLCVEDGEFPFAQALRAFISGDAIGNVTPLGPLASESTKAILSRQRLQTSEAFSSVVLENIFYSVSVAIMVAAGTMAFLIGFRPNQAALTISVTISAVALIGVLVVWWLLTSQPRLLSRFLRREAVRAAEDRIFRFATHARERLPSILLLELAFHASAVAEIYLLLLLLTGHSEHTFLLALVLETVERLITIAFKFVPLRVGVDQAGSGAMAGVLGIGEAVGITIATVRTARNLFWAAVGLWLLMGEGRKR